MCTQTSVSDTSVAEEKHRRMSFTKNQVIEGNLDIESEIGLILPTYCEAANIGKLLDEIENLNLNICILVIDDSSPDGTADVVRRMQKKYGNILLFVRSKKLGLGTAITAGFKIFLLLKNPPKYIVTMDADYSHNPREIPKLLSSIKQGYDLVIGSRYRPGSSIKDWGVLRKAISIIANLITKLRIDARISDYTSGMRCYSAKLVKGIINDLHSQTYEIQIETIRQAYIRKFKITEIPITFINRKKGKSKLSVNEIHDFISYVLTLGRK
jgi:dolichol-phosphate mannosyltransferase